MVWLKNCKTMNLCQTQRNLKFGLHEVMQGREKLVQSSKEQLDKQELRLSPDIVAKDDLLQDHLLFFL